MPDDPHALDQGFVEDLVRAPPAPEQDVRALDDLRRHAVVQVVVHLLDELVVGERLEIERLVVLTLVWGHPHASGLSATASGSTLRNDAV